MPLEVAVDFPDFPKGMEMDIGGLLVKNGETTKVDEEAELRYVTRNRAALKESVEGSAHVKVTGSGKYGPAAVEKLFPVTPVETLVVENPYVEDNDGGEQ